MRMKENQNRMVYSPASYWGEVNSRTSESKEACQLNDERNGRVFVPFIEFERRDATKWNPFVTSFSVGTENGSRDSSDRDSSDTEKPKDLSSLFADSNDDSKDKSCPETKPGFKETATTAANDTIDSVKPNSCSCKSKCDAADSIDTSNGTTDGFPDDLLVDHLIESSGSISNPQDKERHGSIADGSVAELPLSAHFTSLPFQDTTADAQRSSGPESSVGQGATAEEDESNSAPVTGDVSGGLKNETFLALISKQEDEASETSGTKFTQLCSEIAGVPLSATAEPIEDNKENNEGQVPLFHILKIESENSSSYPTSNPGERSFSAASLISYTDQLPRSGSVSMRSDGSISGRSFAFPILPSEWNSSPVRMAKADRRNYRKHRGCRSGLFCCL